MMVEVKASPNKMYTVHTIMYRLLSKNEKGFNLVSPNRMPIARHLIPKTNPYLFNKNVFMGKFIQKNRNFSQMVMAK